MDKTGSGTVDSASGVNPPVRESAIVTGIEQNRDV